MHTQQMNNIMLKMEHDDFSGYDVNSRHPQISYQKPKFMKGYDTFSVDDITVYVEKGIHAQNDELLFVDDNYKGIHKCQVIGVD